MVEAQPEVYPLRVQPELHARVWGGRRLAAVLDVPLPDGPIGESWSMGQANRVLNGPWAGQTLGQLVAAHPRALLGRTVLAGGRRDLPLLFKIIDANDLLSIQVHPDDHYARTVEQAAFGKTEAWYVLDAAPGATVIHGFARPVTAAEVVGGLGDGSITGLVRTLELRAGDSLLVPAGTVHAIGGGLLLAEIQENSDLTYRLYDWGRPRETHVEKSLAVLHPGPPGFAQSAPLEVATAGGTIRYLVACPYFAYQALAVQGTLSLDTAQRSFHILFGYGGAVTVGYGRGTVPLHSGQTILVPAALGAYTLDSAGGRVLRALVPDLHADVIAPLRAAGYAPAPIAALGGAPGNELARLLAPAAHA
ncbi:MAG TPA: type I phosphomannose isomerase catalytic subunit [Chloroflexia bacterium]|nr:type I phosphomannose isomerase catalytic subunit [Chloroflexia bacterium]